MSSITPMILSSDQPAGNSDFPNRPRPGRWPPLPSGSPSRMWRRRSGLTVARPP